jgi:hypothetical protein
MKDIPLKERDGIKIRRQFFNGIILVILALWLYIPYCILTIVFLVDKFVASECLTIVASCSVICLALIIPFIILALLNRKYFGKILCVLNEHGIYHENGFIYWSDIDKIVYTPSSPGLYRWSRFPSYVEIHTKSKVIEIDRAPSYLLFRAKKLHSKLKVGINKSDFWFLIIMFTVFLLIPFIAYLVY